MKTLFKILFFVICIQIKSVSGMASEMPKKLTKILRSLESAGLIVAFDISYEDSNLEFARNIDAIEDMHFSVLGDPHRIKITRKVRIPSGRFSGIPVICYSDWDFNDPYIQETFQLLGNGTCLYR
ncbi:MAG: hypothetical protein V1646_05420 [bacterium]